MRKFRDIIESPFPVPTNALWLKGSNLKGFINGKWITLGGESELATPTNNGLMSAADKEKLDNLILVPEGGTLNQVLKKTATGVAWGDDANTTYVLATTTESGLMSSADKTKLNNIETEANNYTLPNATTSVRGGVLMATAVTDLAGTEDAVAICTKVNALLAALRTAGILTT